MVITPRELLNLDPVAVLRGNYKDTVIHYDDGTKITHRHQEVAFNRFCWELAKPYPDFKIVPFYDVSTFLGKKEFNFDTHAKLLERIFEGICEGYGLVSYAQKTPLIIATMNLKNMMFNKLILNIGADVTLLDATDIVSLYKHENIKAIRDDFQPTPDGVARSYRAIAGVMSSKELDNSLVDAFNSKSINANQVNQCIGPRGFVTNINRTVFGEPIRNGFIYGMDTLYELIAESLTAAKALTASESHIRTSEYASRRLQMLAMSVTGVVVGDCGSEDYTEMGITELRLRNMQGIYYLDEETGKLACIKGDEEHLLGKVLKLRLATRCKIKNPAHVCSVCLGAVSHNFKDNSNVGYVLISYLMAKISQAMLSKKHITASVMSDVIELEGPAARWLKTEGDFIYLSSVVRPKKAVIVLPYEQLSRLADVLNMSKSNVGIERLGELNIVEFYPDGLDGTSETLHITNGDRGSVLSSALLDYIRTTDITVDRRNNFVVPLKDWDMKEPLFRNLLKETDLLGFVHRFAKLAEAMSTKKDSVQTRTPTEKLFAMFDAILEVSNSNLSAIAVLAYATSVYNPDNGDYNLGRWAVEERSDTVTNIMRNRSLSQFMLYEQQSAALKSPFHLFKEGPRQPHPMDALFIPREIMSR